MLLLFGFISTTISISSCTADSIQNDNSTVIADDITPPAPPVINTPIDHGGNGKDKDKDGF